MSDPLQDIQPNVIRIDLFSGVIVDITPVHLLVYRAIEAAAEDKFKDPKVPMMELENAVTPQPDRNDPAYLAELAQVQKDRSLYIFDRLRELCLSFPQGKENILRMFADKLRILRNAATIEPSLDDWQVCFKYLIVTDDHEWGLLNDGLIKGYPLTQEEIDGASRIFRPTVQGKDRARMVEKQTPGVKGRAVDRSASTG